MGYEQYSQFNPPGGVGGLIEGDRGEDCVVIAICLNLPHLFDVHVGIGSCDRTIPLLARRRGVLVILSRSRRHVRLGETD